MRENILLACSVGGLVMSILNYRRKCTETEDTTQTTDTTTDTGAGTGSDTGTAT